ncbi:tripartite tricarboxylate transporter substrate binding protein [Acuticoccus sp.]|uniref:tripartite tricarboxylate transporter substrate binding protein n=1 Tax=Acuticoccus sp. TaxID=1904378 RepID=UPI003B5172B8
MKLKLITLAAGALAAAAVVPAAAQEYPSDTIRMVVPWRAGGGTDTIARAIAAAMEKEAGRAVVVDNLTAGTGNAGHVHVKDAEPDGHTMLLTGSSDLNVPVIFRNVPYALEDFACLGGFYDTPTWVLAHKDQGMDDFADFVERAKERPGELTVGVGSFISSHYVLARALVGMNELDARIIPFDGGGPLMKAILGNQVDIGVIHAPVLLDAVQAGDVKVLTAGGSLENINYEPVRATKTAAEYNAPVEIGIIRGLFVPKDTPQEVREQASALVEAAAKSEDFKAFGENFGFAPVWMDGDAFCDFIQKENAQYREIKAKFID